MLGSAGRGFKTPAGFFLESHMDFIVNMTNDSTGKSKVTLIEAHTFEEAKEQVGIKYHGYSISRISSSNSDRDVYNKIRKIKHELRKIK